MAYTDRFPIVKNFFETKLSVAADASDSRLFLEDAGSLPAFLVGRDYIPIVLRDAGVVREIVYIIGIDTSNGAVDVVRAQEDTAAGNWREGTYVYCTVTADSLQRMRVNGFAPLVDGDLGRPEINVVSATAISMNGDYYSQIEAGMAVRVLTEDGVVEPVDASVGAIHVASVSYEDGVTVVGLQNVSLPSVIAGIDLGLSTAAAPMYHPDTVVADGVTTSQTGNVISALPMIGASATAKGLAGMVPAPAAGKDKKPLTGAGVFADVLDVNILGNAATATLATKAAALSATNPVNMGGTGATTAEQARKNLGITELLEALDASVVHKAGGETINGVKTFTAYPVVQHGTPAYTMLMSDVTKGTVPTSNQYSLILIADKNGATLNNRMGAIQYSIDTGGDSRFLLRAYKNTANTAVGADIGVTINADGSSHGFAPTTPTGSTGNQIVTADYLNGANSGVVHKTGNETIAGTKTFTGDILIDKDNPRFDMKLPQFTAGTNPTANEYAGFRFFDAKNAEMGNILFRVGSGGYVDTFLRAYANDRSVYADLGVYVHSNGSLFGYAPSTPAGSVGTQIVTADFLQKDLTMAGVKRFTANPRIVANNPCWQMQDTRFERGVAPSIHYQIFTGMLFDKNENRVGGLYTCYFKDQTVNQSLIVYSGGTTDNTNAQVGVGIQKDGTAHGFAPTPSANDNTNHIATTEWVRARTKWTYKTAAISTDGSIGKRTLDFKNYLPADTEEYEVLLRIHISRSDSSGTNTQVIVYVSSGAKYMWVQADGSNFQQADDSAMCPVPASHQLQYEVKDYAPAVFEIYALGYRKA